MPKLEINLPAEVEIYAEDIRRFMDAMIFKLGAKAHKGRWEELSIKNALLYLKDEIKELEIALERQNLIEIILESADCANFALIISAIAIERGTNGTD